MQNQGFYGMKKKCLREKLPKFADFPGENKNSTREQFWKSSKKRAWKSFVASKKNEIITPVKKKMRVKKIEKGTRETKKALVKKLEQKKLKSLAQNICEKNWESLQGKI